MQNISAFIQKNSVDVSNFGELTSRYQNGYITVSVLSNLPFTAHDAATLYERFGQNFVHQLPPETICILNDAAHSVTYFSTDFFGTKPLFYAIVKTGLLIDSDLSNLLIFSDKLSINPAKVKEYFLWEADIKPVGNQTFYQGIYRLLPAHWAIFRNDILTIHRLANFTPIRPPETPHQGVENFKNRLVDSVKRRLISGSVAANLSGGLDSSSVAAIVASDRKEPTFAYHFNAEFPRANERDYAQAVAEKYPAITLYELTIPHALYTKLNAVTEQIAQPDPGVLPVVVQAIISETAAAQGAKRLYSGHGGDTIVGYGDDYLDELVETSQWRTLKQAFRAFSSLRNGENDLPKMVLVPFIRKAAKEKSYKRLMQVSLLTWLYYGVSPIPEKYKSKLKKWFSGKKEKDVLKNYAYFAENLLLPGIFNTPLTETRFDSSAFTQELTKTQQQHFDYNFIKISVLGNEILSTLGHRHGIGVSFPLLDKALLETAIQIPEKQKFGNGYLRGVFRDAMTDYLPPFVKNRIVKADFTEAAVHYFRILYPEFQRDFPAEHRIWQWINKSVFEELVMQLANDNFTASQKVKHNWLAMRVINFGIWLNQFNKFSANP